jgi:hypothetical protein
VSLGGEELAFSLDPFVQDTAEGQDEDRALGLRQPLVSQGRPTIRAGSRPHHENCSLWSTWMEVGCWGEWGWKGDKLLADICDWLVFFLNWVLNSVPCAC